MAEVKSVPTLNRQQTFDCGELLALDVNEKILLHGSAWDNANSIVREAFGHRTCSCGAVWFLHCHRNQEDMVHLPPMSLLLQSLAWSTAITICKFINN